MKAHAVVFAVLTVAALAVAAGTPAAPALAPAPEQTSAPPPPAAEFKPFVFLQAGDPELGSPDLKGTVGRFTLQTQRANRIGAALVVICGDLTRNCTDEQLAGFDEAAKQFKMHYKVVPGNHDKPAVFAKHFGPDHYVYTLNNCDFIGVNSELDGKEAAAQWKWLEEALKESRRANRTHTCIVIHNPSALERPVTELLARYGVKVVLCGHLHTTEELPGKGFVTYVSPGTAKFRDKHGLGYRVFKVFADRVEQEFVPLEKEVEPASGR